MSQSTVMLEATVSEILENILGLLSLEGSFEVEEKEESVNVSIDTEDAGRLIGRGGENLTALQLLVNQILSRQISSSTTKDTPEFKRVLVDVADWKKQKEQDLETKAIEWAESVKESGKPMELEPMPAWQRRVLHIALEKVEGVTTESMGEGEDRHLIIKLSNGEEPKEPEAKE
jgi:spoIIIJ-associated protein